MSDPSEWWQRTWSEREAILLDFYGESHPPEAERGDVLAFPGQLRHELPGACSYVFRPQVTSPQSRPGSRTQDWVWVTHGLTQPADEAALAEQKKQGNQRSGRGWELGMITPGPDPWPHFALMLLAHAVNDEIQPVPGQRVGFFLARVPNPQGGPPRLQPFVGRPEQLQGAEPSGAGRALLLWPDLRATGDFTSETGSFGVLIATLITTEELDAVRMTSPANVLLLLCQAGVGQRSLPERESLFAEVRWRKEWARLSKLTWEEAQDELYCQWAGNR